MLRLRDVEDFVCILGNRQSQDPVTCDFGILFLRLIVAQLKNQAHYILEHTRSLARLVL
ncbi:hypothetical protein D3C72_2436060 [compost metagenome]